MKTTIFIKNLKVPCHIGVSEEERARVQTVRVNIEIMLALDEPIADDDIEKTVNYSALRKSISAFVEKSSFKLLETLGTHLADICLENSLAERVIVTLEKPHLYEDTDSVGVTIEKNR